jgi:peptide/nickel transport system ATP-binding protein
VSTLLSVEDLRVELASRSGAVRAVDGVSFAIARGETLALVGESGSGKSSIALAILCLHERAAGARVSGRVVLEGRDLSRLSEHEMRAVRGARAAMIFQEPSSALDPVFSVGDQIAETLRAHRDLSQSSARARATELLGELGLPDPERAYSTYPHELSGGMRQRALIAAAIACEPVLVVADEPTSALDLTVQAEILELLRSIRQRSGMGLLLITHDLALVAENAERVAVMYAGRIVETGPTRAVLARPAHPYTVHLLSSQPALDARTRRREPIVARGGSAPQSFVGCRYRARCPIARTECAEIDPALERAQRGDEADHLSECLFSAQASTIGSRTAVDGSDSSQAPAG